MYILKSKAFTLIELLIVVAIIAILAAIAVPNFLEAQTRAKVSRVKNDMRTYATALEAYYIDNNTYVVCSTYGIPGRGPVTAQKPILELLSTPIAYLTNGIVPNPFHSDKRIQNADAQGMADSPSYGTVAPAEKADPAYASYLYQSGNNSGRTAYNGASGAPEAGAFVNPSGLKSQVWLLHSPGPQQYYFNLGGVLAGSSRVAPPSGAGASTSDLSQTIKLIYDPTNGTISFGGIFRVGGQTGMNYGYHMSEAIQSQR